MSDKVKYKKRKFYRHNRAKDEQFDFTVDSTETITFRYHVRGNAIRYATKDCQWTDVKQPKCILDVEQSIYQYVDDAYDQDCHDAHPEVRRDKNIDYDYRLRRNKPGRNWYYPNCLIDKTRFSSNGYRYNFQSPNPRASSWRGLR